MAALCEFFRIGRIVRPHGVHGAVKLEPMSDSLMRYKRLREAYIERNGVREPITVSDVGVKEDAVYMSISCSASRDDAEALRGAYICVDRAHAMKLPKDTYFVEDLIGCRAEESEETGRIYANLRLRMAEARSSATLILGQIWSLPSRW